MRREERRRRAAEEKEGKERERPGGEGAGEMGSREEWRGGMNRCDGGDCDVPCRGGGRWLYTTLFDAAVDPMPSAIAFSHQVRRLAPGTFARII